MDVNQTTVVQDYETPLSGCIKDTVVQEYGKPTKSARSSSMEFAALDLPSIDSQSDVRLESNETAREQQKKKNSDADFDERMKSRIDQFLSSGTIDSSSSDDDESV